VWQGLDQRGVDGQERIEKVRETYAVRLGHEAEETAIPVKAPRAASGEEFQDWFSVAEENFCANATSRIFVHDLDDVRTVPFGTYKFGDSVGQNTFDEATRREFFEFSHLSWESLCLGRLRHNDKTAGR
jgi:hypothetical protein